MPMPPADSLVNDSRTERWKEGLNLPLFPCQVRFCTERFRCLALSGDVRIPRRNVGLQNQLTHLVDRRLFRGHDVEVLRVPEPVLFDHASVPGSRRQPFEKNGEGKSKGRGGALRAGPEFIFESFARH